MVGSAPLDAEPTIGVDILKFSKLYCIATRVEIRIVQKFSNMP